MKFLAVQATAFLQSRSSRRNLRALLTYLASLLAMVVLYSVGFHVIMAAEGQRHSWITGFYWTLTVMSTLGFGDITFQTDGGRLFSLLVLMSGVVGLLIMLPFAFIQLFYAPWLEAQSRRRAPRDVPANVSGHIIITHNDPVGMSLMERLALNGRTFYVLEPDLTAALLLYDQGVPVVVGDRDSLDTYDRIGAARAALIAATGDDYANTNTAFTVREISPEVAIVAVARAPESVDILEFAGASQVVQLPEMLGGALARRTLGGDVRANVIGKFGELLIAEAPVTGTPWVGRLLLDSRLREATGLTVVGIWDRGDFKVPHPEMRLEPTTALVLAGSEEQLDRFTELTTIYNTSDAPVVIIGGGRVGRAAAAALRAREVPYRIIEKSADRIRSSDTYILGDAADRECLDRAGIGEAPTTIVTTNDDPTNIYLTIYCRRLRPEMQIVSRATLERNVSTLHRAGADFVMSYASMGANAIYNVLEQGDVVMLAEGLDVFRNPVPAELVGQPLAGSGIRERTGCSVVAIEIDGKMTVNPPPDLALPAAAEMILIGSTEGERVFLELYRPDT
jgi:Trk K+ transport system NAD-binding subunit